MKEFKQVLKDLGKRDVTEDMVNKMMAEHDQNKDSTLSWTEFLEVTYKSTQYDICSKDVQAVEADQWGTVLEGSYHKGWVSFIFVIKNKLLQ